MPFDVTSMKPKVSKEAITRKTKPPRDLGPNPWLDLQWEGNLQASFDKNQTMDLDFPGEIIDAVVNRGPRKGQPTTRITGEAADAITLIRDAATKLDLGVSIRTTPARAKGKVTVAWQAKTRKNTDKPGEPDETEPVQ